MEELQSDSESGIEQALRRSVRKKMVFGAALCAALPLLPVVIVLVQNTLPSGIIDILFIPFTSIFLLGALVFFYYWNGSSMLFHGRDILRQIAPPEPFIEGKSVVLNKNPVYVIAKWGSNTLYFVAFYESERTFDKKVRVPRVIWQWEYSHPVGEIKVARREDTFTIPVDKGTYHTGKGVLYSLHLEQIGIVRLLKSFTAKQLNQIVDSLAREVITDGSNSQLVDDDF
ncbi:MAG: hypothetical protein RTV31_17185 [Candidatus Thorarchaeota archaeon]